MAATLVIGLGGTGCNIVERVARHAELEGLEDVEFVVMDTDVNELNNIHKRNARIRVIQTSPRGTVGAALDTNKYARDLWFPLNEGLMIKPFSEGAGQVRAISRLALDHAIRQGLMRPLEEAIESLHGLSGNRLHQEMRVMITGSLAGGTGSGILLPVGMYVRNYLQTRYQDYAAVIRGLFLQPDAFFDVIPDESERNSLRCNAYAAIREIDAFFRKSNQVNYEGFEHVRYNAPQPGSGDRVDYPNVLPYNFIFLLDAINEEGEHLPTKVAYEEHAADIVFAQALSSASAKSNSKEDNIIKKQVESNGRSRYCGAGVSFLEYPVQDIRRYIALRWAEKSISEDWTRIDAEYQSRYSKEGDQSLAAYYVSEFRQHRDYGDLAFIVKAGKGTVRKEKVLSEEGTNAVAQEVSVELADDFVNDVILFADSWNQSELPGMNADLGRVLSKDHLNGIPQDTAEIQQELEDCGGDAEQLASKYSISFGNAYANLKAYAHTAFSLTPKTANAAFDHIYSSTIYDDVFKAHSDNHFFESIIRDRDSGGALQPAGIRFLIYTCLQKIAEWLDELRSDQEQKMSEIKKYVGSTKDFDKSSPGTQSIGEAVRNTLLGKDGKHEGSKGTGLNLFSVLTSFFTSNNDPNNASPKLIKLVSGLRKNKEKIDSWRMLTVEIAALSACQTYLQQLASVYEAFFKSLSSKVSSLRAEIEGYEKDPRFNSRRGHTRRYVCANAQSLRGLFDECTNGTGAGELPSDLCASMHREFVSIIKTMKSDQMSEKNVNKRRKKFDDVFEKTIMAHWINRVGDSSNVNSDIVNRDVIDALIAEARYVYRDEVSDEARLQECIGAYIENVFKAMGHLATPFIERPLNSEVREVFVCSYNPQILQKVDAYHELCQQCLVEAGGDADEDYPATSIMFYRSVYGFCADDLPKYAPAHYGHENRPEGEYHRVYWRLVGQLSPNLSENKAVTPHIDRNWHLISFLPDLNEEHEKKLIANSFRAFIYGLIWHEFENEPNSNKENSFVLQRKASRSGVPRPKMSLLVTNKTPCDRFYEVYDALTYNPRLVNELLSRYEETLENELQRLAAPSVEQSYLISDKGVDSHAYARDDDQRIDRLKQRVMEQIDYAKSKSVTSTRNPNKLDEFTAYFVTSLFIHDFEGNGLQVSPSGRMHMSVFTVPLLYRISLRYGANKTNEIDGMIDGVFDFVREYFSHFCDAFDLRNKCDAFYYEQYLIFEENVAWLERYIEAIHINKTVGAIRSMLSSYFESSPGGYSNDIRIDRNDFDDRWNS